MVEISNFIPRYSIEDLLCKSASWINVVYLRILKMKYGDKVVGDFGEEPVKEKIDVRVLEKIPGVGWTKTGTPKKKK